MTPLIKTSILAAFFAATSGLLASDAPDTLELEGSARHVEGSTASLTIDLVNEVITWSSSDSRLGDLNFDSVTPDYWRRHGRYLSFRYSDDTGHRLHCSVDLEFPDYTVATVSRDWRHGVYYRLHRAPGSIPALSIADTTVSEEDGAVEVALTLDSASTVPVTVKFSSRPGSAGSDDFDRSAGFLTIPPGAQDATITIPLVNDLRVEATEEFTVKLWFARNAAIDDGSATVTIEDSDTTTVSVFDSHVDESSPLDARIPIRLSAPSDFPIVVRHDTPAGTAESGIDFLRRRNDTTFTPGQLESILHVPISSDSSPEGDETFGCVLTGVDGERASLGNTTAAIVTIFDDDDDIKEPRVDEIGWQWPNNAVFRPELNHTDYLMTAGSLVGAVNFGHGTAGNTHEVAGIPFENTGAGVGEPSGSLSGGVSYQVSGAPDSADSHHSHDFDHLFFSEISGPENVRLEVTGLDPAKRYVVQLLYGESGATQGKHWTIQTDLGFGGDVGGPLTDLVRRQFGQGPLGDGVANRSLHRWWYHWSKNRVAREDRRIVSFGLCNRTGFVFENLGWTDKAPALSGFQVREVTTYPDSPDVATLQRISGLYWTGSQLIASCDGGDLLTSPEKIQWTRQDSGTGSDLKTVLDFNGTLLMSARFGQIFTSADDAVSWTPQISGTTEQLLGIIDMGTHVVVLGGGGTILTSSDLVTWDAQDSGTTQLLNTGAWNGSVLVVVGDRGTVGTSSDGFTFTTTQIPGANDINLNSVIWDGTKFVVASRVRGSFGEGVIFTSPDGLSWTREAFTARAALTDLAYNGIQYVAGDQNGSIYTSPNGVDWTEEQPVPNDGVRTVVWTGKRFVAGCQNGDFLWSRDGVTWSSKTCVRLRRHSHHGHTFSTWAAQEGLAPEELEADMNGDGLAEVFNYAMGVSSAALIPLDLPGLLPSIDTATDPDRPGFVFQIPDELPADVLIEVEETTNGQSWSVIASRHGSGQWDLSPDSLLFEEDPVDGYSLVRITTTETYRERPLVLFRLRTTVVE